VCEEWKTVTHVAYTMLKLMSFVQLLTTCGNLHTTLIVHANVKFVVPILPILVFVAKRLLNYFLESPICGKTLCAQKVNLWNGINVNVCLVNVTNAMLMCDHCRNPTLGLSVRMKLTLPKLGIWSPSGLPNV